MWPSSNNASVPGVYNSGQWSFNPTVYQNIPYEQVDWASLAQQWIKMKETMPSVNQGPPPPPAPQISAKSSSAVIPPTATPTIIENQQNDIEGGEAPMDMDTKDDETPSNSVGVSPGGNWNQWGNWQPQWGWGWSGNAGTVPLADNTQSTPSTVDSKVKSQNSDSIPLLNNYVSIVDNLPDIRKLGTCISPVADSFNYYNTAGGTIPPDLLKTNYWSDNNFSGSSKVTSESWIKETKINSKHSQKGVPVEQFPIIDAAKKKQLPAWIREGLNKMEREKQKKLERERMLQEKLLRDQMKSEELLQEVSADSIQKFNQSNTPARNEDELKKSPPTSTLGYSQKRYSTSPSAEPFREHSSRINKEDSSSIRKTKDQIMEESMLKVRRILTEILLEVTENQVQMIAKEEYRRFKSSASVQQIRKNNALSSLTGNLGLDIYESESESSDSEKDQDDKKDDSDEELKMLIDRKKREFQRIEDQIELEIENQEAKERLIAQQHIDNSDDDNYDNTDVGKDVNRVKFHERVNYETIHKSQDYNKDNRDTSNRVSIVHRSKSDERDTNRNINTHHKSNTYTDKMNGDSKIDKAKTHKDEKSKSSSPSSSTSTSSSSDSSTRSSSESSSSSSSNSSNSESESSGSSERSIKKRDRKHKIKLNEEKTDLKSKHKRYRSRSRSASRLKYSRSSKRYSISKSHTSESNDKKHSSPYRKRSPHYSRRSPSYHRENRDISKSKYRELSSRRYNSSSKRRRRSSSSDSRPSRYKRH